MFPFSKSHGAPETTPDTDPSAPQNPARAQRAADIRARAEAHADGVLRGRSEFGRHHVKDALISAFISGADLAAGESTEQPAAPAEPHEELVAREEAQRAQYDREEAERQDGAE